jgi:phosphoribosylglycinamide formyltransferase 1
MARQVSLGVLISGGGTNLQSIIDAIEAKRLDAAVRVVISNKESAYGLVRAKNHGIPTEVLDHKKFTSREAYDEAIVQLLQARGVELVILAGFMRLLSPVLVKAYSNRIMNIHPALLPAFPGLHGQKQAMEYGVRFAGCTVHFVRAEMDHGPIIVQAAVPVLPGDDEHSLAARVLTAEHRAYPLALKLIGEGRVKVVGERSEIAGMSGGGTAIMLNPADDRRA